MGVSELRDVNGIILLKNNLDLTGKGGSGWL